MPPTPEDGAPEGADQHARRDRRQHPDPAARHRAGRRGRLATRALGDHRPARLRGRGLPGAPRVRRRRPRATSTRSSTWTRWARSSTRPASPRAPPWHPHRGFETVTYMIDGIFEHQDSNGGGGLITNGDTQWMTAGGGILHIEAPPEHLVVSGGLFHGIQLWVNLPARDEDDRARATRTSAAARSRCSPRPTAARCCGSSPVSVDGHDGPGITHTPIALRARDRRARRRGSTCRGDPDFNALVYVLAGDGHGRRRAAPGPARASSPCFGAGDAHRPSPPTRSQDSRSPTLDVLHPGRPADPRAGGGLRPVRHEHPRRAHPGVRGLPGRPAGHHPHRAAPRARRPLTHRSSDHHDAPATTGCGGVVVPGRRRPGQGAR